MAITIVIAVIIIAGFLIGIRLMQSPSTALLGNRIGMLAMIAAVAIVIMEVEVYTSLLFWLLLLLGAVWGIIWSQRVRMIQMPQTVAFFNGSGGAASALVAGSSAILYHPEEAGVFYFTAALAVGLGVLTFFGSLVAVGKLQGYLEPRPVHFIGQNIITLFLLGIGIALIAVSFVGGGFYFYYLWPYLLLVFAMYGISMSIRVGGADMPVLISFLNSLSGMAAAITGLTVEDFILVGTGSLVGVAGLILTGLMCRAMNRNLASVLSGFKAAVVIEEGKDAEEEGKAELEEGEKKRGAVSAQEDLEQYLDHEDHEMESQETTAKLTREEEPPLSKGVAIIEKASKIIIVTGYGMAVAQAQEEVKMLVDVMEENNKEVKLAIHPVAGRMPGHMNVLLAEVGIEHHKLYDMESINPEFPQADLVLVVGACDVVNPAANSAEGTPIYGMPILDAYLAEAIVVCNLDDQPGYSGVPNELYSYSHVITIWGDAKETLQSIISRLST